MRELLPFRLTAFEESVELTWIEPLTDRMVPPLTVRSVPDVPRVMTPSPAEAASQPATARAVIVWLALTLSTWMNVVWNG